MPLNQMRFAGMDKEGLTTPERRKEASDDFWATWGLAIILNLIGEFVDGWLLFVIRVGVSVLWVASLVVWLYWVVRDRRERRSGVAR